MSEEAALARVAKLETTMSENDMAKIARLVAFPGSPDDMMNTIAALRDRNAALEGTCRAAGICMSCLYGPADPAGCTDCLGTGWDGGSPYDQIAILEAHVAKLEEWLAGARKWILAVLKDAPQ